MIPKFRAWDKNLKLRLDVHVIDFYEGTIDCYVDDLGVNRQEVYSYEMNEDNYVLMQATGLHDVNGKEIFEGDVVNITGIYDHKIMCEVVEYCKRGAYYDVGSFMLGNFETHHIEIIGNIHEHSHLLDNGGQ